MTDAAMPPDVAKLIAELLAYSPARSLGTEAAAKIESLAAANAALAARCGELEADANRYRWLRVNNHHPALFGVAELVKRAEYLDAAIDAALASQAESQGENAGDCPDRSVVRTGKPDTVESGATGVTAGRDRHESSASQAEGETNALVLAHNMERKDEN